MIQNTKSLSAFKCNDVNIFISSEAEASFRPGLKHRISHLILAENKTGKPTIRFTGNHRDSASAKFLLLKAGFISSYLTFRMANMHAGKCPNLHLASQS